jgi:hypothetical protein
VPLDPITTDSDFEPYNVDHEVDHNGEKREQKSFKRLKRAVELSRNALHTFRENRVSAVREYVGKHYSENGSLDKVPLPMLEMAVGIYIYQLAAKSPSVMVETDHVELKPAAENLRLAVDYAIEHQLDLKGVFQSAVLDALFGIGIVKVGQSEEDDVEVEGLYYKVGRVFVDNVDLDDWVHDMSARRWKDVEFMGNRFRVPLEEARNNESFDKELREKLQPTLRGRVQGSDVEKADEERASDIGSDDHKDENGEDEYQDHVDLWELFLPQEQKLIIYSAEQDEPLEEKDWNGPEHGPFVMLSFTDVPGNTMPLPFVSLMRDLHEMSNKLYNKLARQAERQKTLSAVRNGKEKDGETIRNANDGEVISVDDPRNIGEVKFGGPEQMNLAFVMQAMMEFSKYGGNLETLGGLGAMADTVGQEKLLASGASKRVQKMGDDTMDFASEVVNQVARYLWEDPLIELPLTKRVPGYEEISLPIKWTEAQKEGEFFNYNIDVIPYSMQKETPEANTAKLMNIVTSFVVPLLPLLQQQGLGINFANLFKRIDKYSNIDLLDGIIVSGQPLQEGQGPIGEPSGKAAQTTRRYERVSRPGASTPGKEQSMVAALMGSGQQKDVASLGRPIG